MLPMFVISLSFQALFALFSRSCRALAELLPRSFALLSCSFHALFTLLRALFVFFSKWSKWSKSKKGTGSGHARDPGRERDRGLFLIWILTISETS